ncbi:hypothetical protein GCM10009555_009370 [Acrocarpospora macrocephala]|uniref:RNA polymerase sigma-70 region 4 domain-containing protein n=1 Tax=Acrocarpospora macrocephala TaxID=150177 RepID=A0A5M3WPJ3_9ACTN|nr:hypothetical protein [Acrocarpospora macrocephala]GES10470.1 hypothetical protein Amac_040670 [Acrocarpospora macrocephala]
MTTYEPHVDVHVSKTGSLWLAVLSGVAGGMSAHSLKELQADIAEGLPFLFGDRDQLPVPVFHYTLPGLTEEDLRAFARLQREAAAIAEDYSRTAKARVDQLAGLGLSDADIGELLGLTKQRIQQIRTNPPVARRSA